MKCSTKKLLANVLSAIALILAVTGCATVGKEQSVALYMAASTLESKALGTVTQIESAATSNDIRRIVENDATLLSETDFNYSITPKTKVALLQQLRGLTAYTRALSLVGARDYSGQFSAAVDDASGALASVASSANELKQFATDEELTRLKEDAGLLAGTVATIGEVVIDRWIQNKTVAVAAKTDEHFSAYTRGLADIFAKSSNIAEVDNSGLAGIIHNEVQWRKKNIIDAYQRLGKRPMDLKTQEEWRRQRTELVREFIREIQGGELSVSLAISLRDACLALGKAHSQLAQGNDEGLLDQIRVAIGRVEYLSQVFKETSKAIEGSKDE